MQWEVKRVYEWHHVENHSAQGWELAAVHEGTYYLKRPVPRESTAAATVETLETLRKDRFQAVSAGG